MILALGASEESSILSFPTMIVIVILICWVLVCVYAGIGGCMPTYFDPYKEKTRKDFQHWIITGKTRYKEEWEDLFE